MESSRQQLRSGIAALLACAAAVLGPGLASARVLELVEQQVDARISLPRGLTVSPDGRHLYMAGYQTLVFERDDTTGELAFADATTSTNFMAISPDGRSLYARRYGPLMVFARHPETGTPLFLEDWREGMDGISHLSVAAVVVSPDGRHVYVATISDTLTVFARDARTGVLSHLETYYEGFDGISGLDGAQELAVSPAGAHLYLSSTPYTGGEPALTVFARDAGTGALSFVETVTGGPGGPPLGGVDVLLLSPDGRHVYAAAHAGVLAFVRSPGDGTLGYAGIHDGRADSLALSPDGGHLYAVSEGGIALTVLARDADSGALSVVEAYPSGIGGLDDFVAAALSPDGRHLYLASYDDRAVAALTRDAATGRVSFVAGYAGDVEGDADGLENVQAVAASPDGRHLYAVALYGEVSVLSRSPETGELDSVAVYDESDGFEGLERAKDITVSPDGRNVYVVSGQPDYALAVLARSETSGELTFLEAHVNGTGGVERMGSASSVRVSPDGRQVYVASSNDSAIVAFAREPASGELTFSGAFVDGAGGIDGISGIRSLAFGPGGEHVYTVGYGDEALAVLTRDPATGDLHYLEAHFEGAGGVTGLELGASEVTVSPDGRDVYAVNSYTGVVAFRRDAASGRLTFSRALFGSAVGARSLVVSPEGDYLYVFGEEVEVFSRQAATGTLQLLETESFPYLPTYWGPQGTQSPDGRHLYVAATLGSLDGIVALRRTDGPCRPGPSALCLTSNRFRFEVDWRDHEGRTGTARAVPQGTDESGLLYYFNPDNWEMQVKVIDACAYNDRFWVFAAASTDVEYTLRVTDEVAGVTRTWFNPLGNAAEAITDTGAFATCDAGSPPAARSSPWELPSAWLDPAALLAGASAGAGADLLALRDDSSAVSPAPGKDGDLLPFLLEGLGGKCMDVWENGTADGTPVVLYECHRGDNQRWEFEVDCDFGCSEDFEVRGHGDNCLQPGTAPVGGRTPLVMGSCGGDEVRWIDRGIFPDRIRLEHVASGKCADVEEASTADGTRIILFECDDDANQLWSYQEVRCVPSPIHRCLNRERFEVEVEWRDFAGATGLGRAVSHASSDSGLFWFFTPGNWEMLVKVLDGCGINGRHWVFAAATTNVEYTLRVTDVETGEVREYFNPAGRSAPAITDTAAFATCP